MAAELTSRQFELIAALIRSKGPTRAAARLVLVDGKSNQDAIAATGLSGQSVSNTLGRFRQAHRAICEVYEK